MRFVGVDLAWGDDGGTGVCAVDGAGVIDSRRLTTDHEIVDWMEPYLTDNVVVAIDAPLIVRNLDGRRPCERAISRCFGRHHAAAHSSNLRMSAFKNGVRGGRLATALGLGIDPLLSPRTSVRRAIEMYPHPATVALFDLPFILKYKRRPGRTTDDRCQAFDELCTYLESLATADPPLHVRTSPRWDELRLEVKAPATHAVLDRAEDELDAYVCAYVAAFYWTHGLERCRVVGDLDSGYIVTPVTPTQAQCLDALAV